MTRSCTPPNSGPEPELRQTIDKKGNRMTITHPVHTEHDHTHASGCGHVGVDHDGHTDYLHDGHRHAGHDDHWDEH